MSYESVLLYLFALDAGKLTSADLLQLGIVDSVVPEPDPAGMRLAVVAALNEASPGDRDRRVDRATGRWIR